MEEEEEEEGEIDSLRIHHGMHNFPGSANLLENHI